MSTIDSISRTYTKGILRVYHCVDDNVILDVWKSYLREWTKLSDNNEKIEICKPARLLCASYSIPSEIRSEIWFVISGAKQLMNKYSNIEEKTYKYLSTNESTQYLNQINKDFERTFVTRDLPTIRDKIQQALRRMLIGYANYNPKVGYAQGMNMVAAFILRQFLQHNEFFNTNYNMYHEKEGEYKDKSDISSSFTIAADIADNTSSYNRYIRSSHSSLVLECDNNEQIIEEQAFWCFVCVMENIHTLFQKKLVGYHKSVECLINILKVNSNILYKHFENIGGISALFTGVFIKWFTSLFAYPSFNLETTQQLWDLWFLYQFDYNIFVKFAFLIFDDHKELLLSMDELSVPVFCISSQCSINDTNWMLKLTQLKTAPLFLGNNNNYNHNDDEKIENNNNKKNEKLIEICSINISETRAEQSYGEYKIDIKCMDNIIFSNWKRYSEFERLNYKLKLLGIQSDSNYPFPSKSWLFASNNPSLMRSRKNILNEYLRNVLKKYNYINSSNKDDTLQILHEFTNYFANH